MNHFESNLCSERKLQTFANSSLSPLTTISFHWRLQSLANIDKGNAEDLHYTAVYTMARRDREKIKNAIISLIQENMKTVEPSKEESLFVFTTDFFELLES